jgi:L-amino acid N-acyltransferase YncA
MKVGYSDRAASTAAFALIAEGWNEMVQDGHTPEGQGFCPVAADDRVLYAERDDGEIVGVLCFREHEALHEFVITLAYVEPTSRRQGAWRLLYAALGARGKLSSVHRVSCWVHVDNLVAQEALKHMGKLVVGLMYETPVAL